MKLIPFRALRAFLAILVLTGRAIHNIKAILSSEVVSDAAMNAVYGCLTRVEQD